MPGGGHQDEHTTHFTRAQLTEILTRYGFAVEEVAYVGGSDLLMLARKLESAQGAVAAPASSAA
jgi:hypothetical protein